MSKETICAVIVTHNRKQLLNGCIDSLKKQIEPLSGIYIIDNSSTDGTSQLLFEKGYLKELPPENIDRELETTTTINLYNNHHIKIHYVKMHVNNGGAGGFNEGIKRAYNRGYEWIWLMDDDVKPEKSCLYNLIAHKSDYNAIIPLRLSKNGEIEEFASLKYNLSNPFLINPREISVIDKFDSINDIPPILELNDFTFEGPLLHRSLITKIGYPRKDFFIFGDDTEYSLRISKIPNEKIVLIKNAIMYRMKKIHFDSSINWKTYYSIRNVNFITLNYNSTLIVKFRPVIVFIHLLLYHSFKLNLNKKNMQILYYAFKDSFKKELPLRYKPE